MKHRPEVRVHRDVGGSTTWEYSRPEHATPIARQARAGEYVYAVPVDRPVPGAPAGGRAAPPDLSVLRAALAERGLELESQGAFYFRVRVAPGARK